MHIDRPIAIALTLFIILLLMFFLVVPEYNTFTNLRTELGEKKAEYNAEFDYYNAIAATYFTLQSRQEDVNKVDSALPQNSDIGEVVYYLQKNAKDNGLIVKDLFLSKSSLAVSNSNSGNNITNSVGDMIFSVDLFGDYASLENFIISLEKSSRIFEIASISFNSASGPPYSFSLQIKTHSY
jgi:Tfp pilus assembly protein PilO